jgi:transcriptional regulator with GAF, ATPase, and Fis domain
VAFNCAAIPESLLESELFGYVKGAFTGAEDEHVGLFVKAHGGTLFLDEIGEMPLTIQSKLLRVLQDKEVCPVGSDKPIMVDVRIICTTNHDLNELVAKGLFREDLFYRINVVMINVPPLRERREDIPLIAEHALAQYAAENNTLQKDFTDDVKKYLMNYPWPGNARELINVMYNLAIFVEGPTITLNDILNRKGLLPHPIIHEATLDDADETLLGLSRMIDEGQLTLAAAKRAFEKLQIARALKLYNGQITSASEHLKMPRPQVSRLMKRYGLKV